MSWTNHDDEALNILEMSEEQYDHYIMQKRKKNPPLQKAPITLTEVLCWIAVMGWIGLALMAC